MKKKYLYLKKGILVVLSASTIVASMPLSVYADEEISEQNSAETVNASTSEADSGEGAGNSTVNEAGAAGDAKPDNGEALGQSADSSTQASISTQLAQNPGGDLLQENEVGDAAGGDSQTESENEAESGSQDEAASEPQSESQDEAASEPQSEPENEADNGLQSEPQDEPAGEPQSEPMEEVAGEPQSEPENKAAGEPQSEPENKAAGESQSESQNKTDGVSQSESQNKTSGKSQSESESVVNSQTGDATGTGVKPSTQSEARAESTEDSGNQETESKAKSDEKAAGDGTEDIPENTSENSQTENKIYTKDDVEIVKVEEPSSSVNGAQNGYKFTFNIKDDTKIYSAHVYGNGVDEDVLKELAAAYFNGLNGKDSSVTKNDFTDAEKHSVNHDYMEDYDSELCWAYAASDAVWQTGWTSLFDAGIFNVGDNASAYFKSEDDLTDYAAYCMYNYAGFESDFLEWLFTGKFNDSDEYMKYGTDTDDQLLYAYYSEDLYKRVFISDVEERFDNDEESFNNEEKSFKSSYLDDVAAKKAAATLGIYYVLREKEKVVGGHALSLTGYISDSEGNPLGVILADPDDSVRSKDEPDDPRLKKNKYDVCPIYSVTIGGKSYYDITQNDYYCTLLSDMVVLANSDNKTKVNASKIPLEQRGISANFNNSGEYSFNSDYTFNIPVNSSFLSYYDINSIKYRLYDEAGNLVTDSLFSHSKSDWKQMILDQKSDISLCFENALKSLSNGKYRLEAFIDKECFYGNYGWFASKANDGAGYFDKLVDTWITLFRYIPEPKKEDNKGHDTSSSVQVSEEVKAYQEALLQAIVQEMVSEIDKDYSEDYSEDSSSKTEEVSLDTPESVEATGVTVISPEAEAETVLVQEITTDLSLENVKETVQEVVTDLMKALVKDEATIAKISAAGIDLSKVDIKDLKVVASASINAPKAGKVVLSGKSLAKLNKDKAFAMIKLADGTTSYVKINVKADGSIEIDVPQNAESLTLLSL